MENFGALVARYFENNTKKKAISDLVEKDNKEIKQIMLSAGDEVREVDGLKVTCKTIESEDFDQAKLLYKIKQLWVAQNPGTKCPWIQTVEVVDMEAVTNAIYDGMIQATDLADCKTKKTQTRLTVTKIKKK